MRRLRWRDLSLIATIGGFVAWYLLLGPTMLGGPATYVLVSGTSMEPTLRTGDLVIVRRSEDYAAGEIVAFRVPDSAAAGSLVIHRLVGGSDTEGFVMRGDNRMGPDPWRPTEDDIVGSAAVVLPGAGNYLVWLRQPAVFASLAAAITVFIVVLGNGTVLGSSPRPVRTRTPS